MVKFLLHYRHESISEFLNRSSTELTLGGIVAIIISILSLRVNRRSIELATPAKKQQELYQALISYGKQVKVVEETKEIGKTTFYP